MQTNNGTCSVSLMMVLVGRTVGSVVVLSLLLTLWVVASYEDALDKTDAEQEVVLGEAFRVGADSTSALVIMKLDIIANLITHDMASFFQTPKRIITEIRSIAAATIPDYAKAERLLARYLWTTVQALSDSGITELTYIQTSPPVLRSYFYDDVLPNFTMVTIVPVSGNPLPTVLIGTSNSTGGFEYGPCTAVKRKPTGNCTIENNVIATAIYYPPTTLGTGTEYRALRTILGKVSVNYLIILSQNLAVDFGLRTAFLSQRFADVELPEGSRLFGVQQYGSSIGTLLGTSHGPAYGSTAAGNTLMNVTNEVVNQKIRETGEELFRTEGWRVQTFTLNLTVAEEGGVKEGNGTRQSVHWGVVRKYVHAEGLLFWIVVVVPQEVVLGEITAATEVTRAQVAETQDAAEQDLSRARVWIVVINVAAGVVLAALSVVLSKATTDPLRRLAEEMGAVSTMDLEGAGEEGKGRSRLMEVREIEQSFSQVVANMREYRTFLPDAVLLGAEEEAEEEAAAGCQAPQGEVAIVFTDIQGSTALWEAYGGAMGRALKVHNGVMREAIMEHKGYEVKTIGDAFMVAFGSAAGAVRFCLAAQEGLVRAEWPTEVLQATSCAPETVDGELTWTGFRVRMGVHTGEVETEVNPVTGRTDYFGNVVNMTARIEATGVGGTVGVTREVLDRVENALPAESFVVTAQGQRALKGVSQKVELYSVVPATLRHRSTLRFRNLEATQPDALSGGDSGIHTGEGRPGSGVGSVVSKSSCSTRRRGPPVTKLSMREAFGTIGHVEFVCDSKKEIRAVSLVAQQVAAAVDAAIDRTFGLVAYMCGGSAVLTWNTGKVCSQHANNAARFTSFFFTELDARSVAAYTTVGLCTGLVVDGNAGSDKRRFMTTVGSALHYARHAALLGQTIAAQVLILEEEGYPGPASEPALKRYTRPLGRNSVTTRARTAWGNEPKQGVAIHELRVVLALGRWGFDDDTAEAEREWGASRALLVNAIEANDAKILMQPEGVAVEKPLQFAAQLIQHPASIAPGVVIARKHGVCYSEEQPAQEDLSPQGS